MLFNSFGFAAFFLIFILIYYAVPKSLQKFTLLAGSLFFYGYWDWRLLGLLGFCIVSNFGFGLAVEYARDKKLRKIWMVTAVVVNLALLGVFKYAGFFLESFSWILNRVGTPHNFTPLNIILPIGISFFTFQGLSYVIDVYDGTFRATRNLIEFASFKAFFPQLIAGPIERAGHLLVQMKTPKKLRLEFFERGLPPLLWGLFLKVVIADNLAVLVDKIFATEQAPSGAEALASVYAFTFQIYADFAGYSLMAVGLAALMGFDLMQNFDAPYLSHNPREFWRRWHISLSSWLRDYLYIRLGGNRKGEFRRNLNFIITMLLGGLWHGAAWNFVVWGGYHGGLIAATREVEQRDWRLKPKGRFGQALVLFLGIFLTFQLAALGWLFFRARSFEQIQVFLHSIVFWQSGGNHEFVQKMVFQTFFYGGIVLLGDVFQRRAKSVVPFGALWTPLRIGAYVIVILLILVFGVTEAQNFLYFQF